MTLTLDDEHDTPGLSFLPFQTRSSDSGGSHEEGSHILSAPGGGTGAGVCAQGLGHAGE